MSSSGANCTDMKITRVKISELIPYINNTRTHTDEQVNQVASSIKEFGFTNPVLIDEQGGIIAGHCRVLASKKLKMKEVPCIELKHLTEAQKKAYVIADNKLALNAGWDEELLRLEIENLKELDFDIDLLGFDDSELDELLNFEEEKEIEEDEVPEVDETKEPYSKLGDVWLLGRHRLMCGDSTDKETVEKLMNGQKADMVFTDPPYGVGYQSNMREKTKKFEVLKNDDVFLDIKPIIDIFSKGWVFVWASWKVQTKWIEMFKGFGYPTNIIIWHKPGGGIGDLKKTFSSDYEVALVWHRGAGLTGKRIGSVWTINKDGSTKYLHPTQKPVALSVEAMDKTTKKGYNVLDLFGGSGSTLIGAEQTGRNAYLMELDEKYTDVTVKRYNNLGKEDIKLIRGGKEYTWEEVKEGLINNG